MIFKKRLICFISILIIWFQSVSFLNAKEIYAFCLVSRSDIINAKLAQEEISRFAGKEIKFILVYPVEEGDKHLIADISDEEDSAVSLITGMYGPLDLQEFKDVSGGINYKNEIKVNKGDARDSTITYSYDNFLRINDEEPTELKAKVKQVGVAGLSFKSFNFQIDCRSTEHTYEEKLQAKSPKASKTPKHFQKLIENIQKEAEKNSKQPKVPSRSDIEKDLKK